MSPKRRASTASDHRDGSQSEEDQMWSRRRMIAAAAGIGFSALVAGSGLGGRFGGRSDAGREDRASTGRVRTQPRTGVPRGRLPRAGRAFHALRHPLPIVLALGKGHATDTLAIGFAHSRPARLMHGRREPGMTNYLMGADPRGWIRHVARFAGVRYAGLYRGIDLDVHAGRAAQFEYDFHVAVGADPSRIQLALHGARAVRVASDGALVVRLLHGNVRNRALMPGRWLAECKPASVFGTKSEETSSASA